MDTLEVVINEIIETMISEMGNGGMDISYSGHNYEKAKEKAAREIILLIKQAHD